MFNSVALDVVIGLVFIYLLYSLFATVLSEIIATKLGLRARNLKEAVDRMLNDEKEKEKTDHGIWNFFYWLWDKLCRLWESLKLLKNPNNAVINNFYNHPEIKYLGTSGLFKNPSSFKAVSFSKTLLYVLFGDGTVTGETIDAKLKGILHYSKNANEEDEKNKLLDPETAKYIHSLWEDSDGDVLKFKQQLESWFDRTMEQATEWYKRKIQMVLLILGFFLASFFNADTFVIVKKLSVDKDARDKMVSMANAYIQKSDWAGKSKSANRLDSLLLVKEQLNKDMVNANSILGTGGWLPDTVRVITDSKTKTYSPQIDIVSLSKHDKKIINGRLDFSFLEKIRAMFRLVYFHFWGFLVTAIAISLGAPFWFDLLNKLMKLRTSTKQEPETGSTASATMSTQPITVSINTKNSEEAVG